MIIDHASMAFEGTHVAKDSAYFPDATTVTQSAFELDVWMSHLCAPARLWYREFKTAVREQVGEHLDKRMAEVLPPR